LWGSPNLHVSLTALTSSLMHQHLKYLRQQEHHMTRVNSHIRELPMATSGVC
jgi:hypothetical protein